ncbi:MAG: heme-binding domain-containing protein [Gemmatimonadota bacterium]
MSNRTENAVLLLVGVFVVIQFVPYGSAENPPVEEEVYATPEVRDVLRRACYDCHSNETRWPWYARVAPVKWLVRYDVAKGRDDLNFSTWNRYSPERQAHKLEEVVETVTDGSMPPRIYLPLHPDARLTNEEVELLRAWALEQMQAD